LETIPHVKQTDVYYPSRTATIVMEGSWELKQSQVEAALKKTKYTIKVFWKK
jgi:hypothetical protein